MTRVLRSHLKKNQIKEDQSSNLSISSKSKTIKRNTKKSVIAKSKENQQNDVWSINSIASNIFKYVEKNEIINFNTVCKTWNNITNPIIHKTIKLQRERAFQNKDHDKNLDRFAKIDAEVKMCIANNSKHAPFIKEFKLNETLEPQRAIQLFETFRFITNLTVEVLFMTQDLFISTIIPLTQLQELNIKQLSIYQGTTDQYLTPTAVLPQSLKKLSLGKINMLGYPEFFAQIINSHSSLIEFRFDSCITTEFLEPLFKNYPTLKTLEFKHIELNQYQTLIKIFECNPQLTSLFLEPSGFNSSFLSDINHHLTNLEEFSLIERIYNNRDSSPIISKFLQPTKIKKLKLDFDRLSECSINSILLNCPDLEELSLSNYISHLTLDSVLSISVCNSVKLRKLYINCNSYTESSYSSILLKCSHLKELDIMLPRKWKECVKIIGSVCSELESLKIWPSCASNPREAYIFHQELYKTEFLTSNSLYKSTITNLTLYRFNIYESRAEYFNSFSKLKYIEYKSQNSYNSFSNRNVSFDNSLWPNYRLDKNKISKYDWDDKLVKLNTYV
jgi:hypothetical protein